MLGRKPTRHRVLRRKLSTSAVREQFLTEVTVSDPASAFAPDLLAQASGLSKLRVKDAMQKGAVWLSRAGRRPQRLRRATGALCTGDRLSLYYDSVILAYVPPPPRLVADAKRYSVWDKPAGLLVEGSRYGDHATLLRQVEHHFSPTRPVWLVHRLDLEASGLILLAHTAQAAAGLSALFQARSVHKRYFIEVQGIVGAIGAQGSFDTPLDGKAAATAYTVVGVNAAAGMTQVEITMLSGRHHQIRRHFADAGYPVLGDLKYGSTPHPDGMRLAAVHMAFQAPWEKTSVEYSLARTVRTRWGWPEGSDR